MAFGYRFPLKMYSYHLSSVLTLVFLTTLPASFSAPGSNPDHPQFDVICRKSIPTAGHPTWYHIAPFPSHCRFLANHLAMFTDAQALKPFDLRYTDAGAEGRSIISAPYLTSYGTCEAYFFTDPTRLIPDPNRARFADFGTMTALASKTCFEVLPGEESRGNVAALGTYSGLDGNIWRVRIAGPLIKPASTGGNATVVDGGFEDVGVEELWSNFNESAALVHGSENGTSAAGRVDVT